MLDYTQIDCKTRSDIPHLKFTPTETSSHVAVPPRLCNYFFLYHSHVFTYAHIHIVSCLKPPSGCDIIIVVRLCLCLHTSTKGQHTVESWIFLFICTTFIHPGESGWRTHAQPSTFHYSITVYLRLR